MDVGNKQNELRERIKQWREQREQRLLDRIYKRNQSCAGLKLISQPVSTAVLGIKKCPSLSKTSVSGVSDNLKTMRKSTFSRSDSHIKKNDQFKSRFSHGNFINNCKPSGQNNTNLRPSLLKNKSTDRFVLGKCNKNEKKFTSGFTSKVPKQIDSKTHALLEKSEPNADNKKRDELFSDNIETNNSDKNRSPLLSIIDKVNNETVKKDEISDDISKNLNSTFILTGDGEDENLPSPIKNVNKTNDTDTTNNLKFQSILRKSTKVSKLDDLRNNLSKWASSRGESTNKYRHLNCFVSQVAPKTTCKTPLPTVRKVQFKLSGGKSIFTPMHKVSVNQCKNEESVGVTKTIQEADENSHEEEKLVTGNCLAASTPEDQIAPCSSQVLSVQPSYSREALKSMTISALEELLSLILAKYSLEECEECLLAIRQRNIEADELPIYWQCIAAIEETRGNMYLALDSYERAIQQGAEPNHIDSCLNRLFDKFKELNITYKEEKENVPRDQSLKAACNSAKKKEIFKSTIIAFARVQKKIKQFNSETGDGGNSSVKYLVTPVRRSTRFSMSRMNSSAKVTNNVKELLQDDENSENHNVEFKTNKALLQYF